MSPPTGNRMDQGREKPERSERRVEDLPQTGRLAGRGVGTLGKAGAPHVCRRRRAAEPVSGLVMRKKVRRCTTSGKTFQFKEEAYHFHNMDEERFRDLIGSCPLPYGTQENPDEVLNLWEAWESGGISKPVNLEQILNPAKGEEHTQLIFREVVECIRSMEAPQPLGKLIFWQTPLARLDAFVKALGGEGHVVVFDTFLNGALSFTSFSAMACAFDRPGDELIDRITAGFFHHIDQFLGRGDRDLQEELFHEIVNRDHETSVIGSYVKLGLSSFLLAHEVAHVVLGHTLKKSAAPDVIDKEVGDALARQEEFEADEFALRVYRELSSNTEKWPTIKLEPLYSAVPLFLFDFLAVYHRRHEFVTGRKLNDSRHPLPHERKQRLLDLYPDLRNEHTDPLYEGLLEFAEHLVECCENYPAKDSHLPAPPPSPL
jgi:hypothetical protein